MTTKKGESAPPETVAVAEPSRRRVLRWLWWGLGLAAAGELAWIGLAFVRPRRPAGVAGSDPIFIAGPVDDFAPGTVSAFPAGSFYLARLASGGFLALDRTCTHLGCTVPWNADTGRFDCPCHASSFDITGVVLGPPAPRPLDRYPVRIENGVVKVDLRSKLQRTAFEASQAVSS
jgi:cytochrome b6-f complex iron-sulfur subunit